jgi:hypothetical protein
MDYPATEKEQLLINLVQLGSDLWGVARTGGPCRIGRNCRARPFPRSCSDEV